MEWAESGEETGLVAEAVEAQAEWNCGFHQSGEIHVSGEINGTRVGKKIRVLLMREVGSCSSRRSFWPVELGPRVSVVDDHHGSCFEAWCKTFNPRCEGGPDLGGVTGRQTDRETLHRCFKLRPRYWNLDPRETGVITMDGEFFPLGTVPEDPVERERIQKFV